MNTHFTRITSGIALLGIVLFALFLRSYHIDSAPAGLYPDEAVNAADALTANETGDYKLFYPNNYGREGLFINLQAVAFLMFGNTLTALKLWSIIFGTLAVAGMYFLGSELFHRRSAGLIASFMTATSFWAINFSRIGFRAIMVTALLSFLFYYFFRGLRTRRLSDFAISGFLVGLGLHTYIAFRLVPIIFIFLLPALILSYERFLARYWKHAAIFIFAAAISAAPMFYDFFISHPEHFDSRADAVSIFSPSINHGDFLGTLGKTFGLSLIKYNFWGDQNWRHNYPPYPILDPFIGFFFLAGFLYIIWKTVTLIGRRFRQHERDTHLAVYMFLLSSFFVMLMPEFLTNEGLPHALRSIGTQMPVFLIATLPAFWLVRKAFRSQTGSKTAFLAIIMLTLTLSALFNITKYFVFYAHNPNQAIAFNLNLRNIADYLLALPPQTNKYVISTDRSRIEGNHLPINVQPIFFFTYRKIENLTYLLPDTDTTIARHDSVIILINDDSRVIENIRRFAPDAIAETIDLHPGTQSAFTIIRLP